MLLAADNFNPASPASIVAMREMRREEIMDSARRMVDAGANLIDLNPGPLARRKPEIMKFLVETVEEAAPSARLILDSPSAKVIEAGLSVCKKPPVITAVTLEPEKLETILPLAAQSGADLVALLLDEHSMPPREAEAKIAVALEIQRKAQEAGVGIDKLIFDPVLPNLSWPDAMDHINGAAKAIRMISTGMIFGEPARTMAGFSNLRSGGHGRWPAEIEDLALATLGGAGLSIALADVWRPGLAAAFKSVNAMVDGH